MKLSRKGEYALKALLFLSCRHLQGSRDIVTIHEISKRERIPEKFLSGILLTMKKSGILQSHRGINGGYTLNREPKAITLGEVLRVIDGPLAPIACVSRSAHVPCLEENRCGIQSVMAEVRDAIAGVLDRVTMEEMCRRVYGQMLAKG